MKKQALITGASKGLGKAIAYELSSRGYELLLIARSEDLLKDLAASLQKQYNTSIYFLGADLTKPESINNITSWCIEQKFEPEVLINNAGFACWGYFDNLSLERQTDLIHLNINSVVTLTYRLLPLLKKKEKAFILNVCSTAAYQAVPTMALYSASKSFIRIFTRALRQELKRTSVSVTCLSPGPMSTDFINEANMHAL